MKQRDGFFFQSLYYNVAVVYTISEILGIRDSDWNHVKLHVVIGVEFLSQPSMNDLPEIGYNALRKELWDPQGANIACG